MDIKQIVKQIKSQLGSFVPEIALVLGSGYDQQDFVQNKIEITYESVGMTQSSVEGHSGKFVFGTLMGKKVALCTRYHFYERKNTELVCLPFFVLKQLGIKTVILQTSAGAVNLSYKVGDIVAINDHINMTGDNPLLGIVPVNFVNMSDCYDDKLLNLAHKIALKNKIELKDGVHLQVSGPNYETRAEIKMFRSFGADTVSMSTAYDCLIARYLNIKVLAFATIVNETSAEKTTGLNHKEVLENSKVASKNLIALISGIVKEM